MPPGDDSIDNIDLTSESARGGIVHCYLQARTDPKLCQCEQKEFPPYEKNEEIGGDSNSFGIQLHYCALFHIAVRTPSEV